jgi:hypothetical protein
MEEEGNVSSNSDFQRTGGRAESKHIDMGHADMD